MAASSVIMNMWQYLLALETDERRFKFIQNVYNREFDVDILKIGHEICIRAPYGSKIKYYMFVVNYCGRVAMKGKGNFIGLQLKRGELSSNEDLKTLSLHYNFGGQGIIVPADWIMMNLYKKEENHFESDFSPVDMEIDNFTLVSTENGATPKPYRPLGNTVPSFTTEFERKNFGSGLGKTVEKRASQSPSPIRPPKKFSENGSKSSLPLSDEPPYNKPENFTNEIQLITNANGAVRNAEITNCDLCTESVEIGRGIILRECLHSFCKQCIRGHIQQNANYSVIRCPYSKKYVCECDILDEEIKDLGGESIYNKILGNRLNEYVGGDQNAHGSKCKAAHNRGKSHVLKTQTSKEANTKSSIEKCRMCSNRANVQLSVCRHWFCRTCIQNFFNNQAFDPKNITINCIACNVPVSESDVLLYGNKQIAVLRKSKIAATNLISKSDELTVYTDSKVLVESIKSEGHPKAAHKKIYFEKCQICVKPANAQLSQCQHWFCNKCIQDLIKNQAVDPENISINCVACQEPVSEFDILQYGNEEIFALCKSKRDAAKLAPTLTNQPSVCDSKVLVECLKCEELFEDHLIQKCMKCTSSICLKCATATIMGQIAYNCPIKCLFCQTLLDESQIAAIKTATLGKENLGEVKKYEKSVEPFMCCLCKQSVDRVLQIVLTNCAHQVCKKCLYKNVSDQLNWSSPKCPICCVIIDQIQLKIIGFDLDKTRDSVQMKNQPAFKKTDADSLDNNLFKCEICQQSFELRVTNALLFCNDRFCYPCIIKALNDQLFVNKMPSCPKCTRQVSSSDIIHICGTEGFNRYMDNKRINQFSYKA